jgi:hypothetical protein
MGMKKSFTLLIIFVLAISSLIIVKPALAQSISKPSVPEFTVKYVDYSYDVPTTYGIDQSTGKNVTIQTGYHVDNRTIEFTIKNQPFTPYNDSTDSLIGLYYNFRAKGHDGTEWVLHPFAQTGQDTWQSTFTNSEYYQSVSPTYPASNTEYTDTIIKLDFFNLQNVTAGNQVDFQIMALAGHVDLTTSGSLSGQGYHSFTGQSSDWSNTQTITIANQTTSTPTPPSTSPNPTVPEFPTVIITFFLVVTILLGTVVKNRKQSRKRLSQQNFLLTSDIETINKTSFQSYLENLISFRRSHFPVNARTHCCLRYVSKSL